jgi:hypothetical protein
VRRHPCTHTHTQQQQPTQQYEPSKERVIALIDADQRMLDRLAAGVRVVRV